VAAPAPAALDTHGAGVPATRAPIQTGLLRWKGIEATEKLAASSNSKVVIIGAGKEGLPIILGSQ
jgi:hypothetical protein